MTDRRYSIIPAGAVTDPTIERGDLRVLAFLGTFTNKLGWCFLSQVTMAAKLDTSRATVQRALARLVDAGWVQIKISEVSGRPHACHAYRVIMDRDDEAIGPSDDELDDQNLDEGCPPVSTPVPSQDEQGCPPSTGTGVPTHARAHNDQDSSSRFSDPRARDGCLISPEAFKVADEIATIAGHDTKFLPPRWVSDGPAMRVQMMFDRGWRGEMMIETARSVMQVKSDGPPLSIRYFEKPFSQAHARQSQPLPLPEATNNPRSSEVTYEAPRNASDWKSRRDRGHSALDRFGQALADAKDDQSGGSGAQVVPIDVAAGRR